MTYSDLPKRDDTPISLFNPLRTDFIAEIRNDDNKPIEYLIRSMEINTFPAYIANIMLKKLITEVKYERDINLNDEEAENEIRKEILINES